MFSSCSLLMSQRACLSARTLNHRKPAVPTPPKQSTEETNRSISVRGLVRVDRRISSGRRLIWIIRPLPFSTAHSRGEARGDAQRRRALEQRLVVERGLVEVEALERVPVHGLALEDAL